MANGNSTNPYSKYDLESVPDGWSDTPAPAQAFTPPAAASGVRPGESVPGNAMTDRLGYILGRGERSIEEIMQPSPQTDPQTGKQYWIDPISKQRTDHPPMAVSPTTPAPDRVTEAIGSGVESMLHHPIQSWWMPFGTFAPGFSNEMLRDYDPWVREAAGAAENALPMRSLWNLASIPAHLLSGHGGGLVGLGKSILHGAGSAASALPSMSKAEILGRLYRIYSGSAIGSETPYSRYTPGNQLNQPPTAN